MVEDQLGYAGRGHEGGGHTSKSIRGVKTSKVEEDSGLQGYLAHKKQRPPEDHHAALGIVLL